MGFEVREIRCFVIHIHYLYKLKKTISNLSIFLLHPVQGRQNITYFLGLVMGVRALINVKYAMQHLAPSRSLIIMIDTPSSDSSRHWLYLLAITTCTELGRLKIESKPNQQALQGKIGSSVQSITEVLSLPNATTLHV